MPSQYQHLDSHDNVTLGSSTDKLKVPLRDFFAKNKLPSFTSLQSDLELRNFMVRRFCKRFCHIFWRGKKEHGGFKLCKECSAIFTDLAITQWVLLYIF